MRLYRGHLAIDAPVRHAVVTLGNFDGVHLGHQRLMAHIEERAAARGGESVVFTFRPHPVKVLAPLLAPPLITSYDRKLELLGALGLDVVVEEPFDASLAAHSPREFVEEVLCKRLDVEEIVIGYDFTFGRGRAGNVDTLRELGAERGFSVHVEPAFAVNGLVASSTKVREFVLEGRVRGAALLLGRHHTLSGTVVRGAGRGRTIGFPTANLACTDELLPRPGVYACHARLDGEEGLHRAVTNIGYAPTFAGKELTVEAHLLDFAADLYQRVVTLELVDHLRDERRFSGADALIVQIKQDAENARKILSS